MNIIVVLIVLGYITKNNKVIKLILTLIFISNEYNNIINDSSSNNVNIFVDNDENISCNGINNFDADYV